MYNLIYLIVTLILKVVTKVKRLGFSSNIVFAYNVFFLIGIREIQKPKASSCSGRHFASNEIR